MSEVGANRRILVERELQERTRLGLQGTSEPINRSSLDIEWLARGLGAASVNAIAHGSTTIEGPLPYGATLVPYRIWSQFSEDGKQPMIPDSSDAIDAAIDTFWPGDYGLPHFRYGQPVGEAVQAEAREKLRQIMRGLSTHESSDSWSHALKSLADGELTPRQWRQYTAAHNRQLAHGDRYTLDEISYAPMNNFDFNERFGVFRELVGRHQAFLVAGSTEGLSMPVLARIRTPIGPYGRALAEKLLLMAAFMSHFDEQDYWLRNDAVPEASEHIVANHTTRAAGYDPPTLADSFVAGLREADEQALSGSLAVLTSSRVKGYDRGDHDRLVRQLILDDVVNEFALLVRQGAVASAALYGVFLPDIVAIKPDGHLKISSQGVDVLQALQEISDKDGVEQLHAYEKAMKAYGVALVAWEQAGRTGKPPQRPRDLVRTWLACPYAGLNRSNEFPEPGAISRRSPAMLAIYECMQPLTAGERRVLSFQRQRPHFGRLIDMLITTQ